jgi:magnesium-transporting ATPase (P-type)
MEYYYISLIISIIIFGIIYLLDKKTPENDDNYENDYNNENYQMNNINNKTLFNTNNFLLFGIIYIVTTVISFYTFTSSFNINSLIPLFLLNVVKMPEPINKEEKLFNNNMEGDEVDPKILNKINDNINIGFNPPNMDYNDDNDNNDNNDNNDKN